MLPVALVIGIIAIAAWWYSEDPDEPYAPAPPRSVHRAVPDPADPFDEPELRLLAEDDYLAALFGEPRRGPEFITYEPLGGVR